MKQLWKHQHEIMSLFCIGRGSGGEQTGWKIDNLFFVRIEDCYNSGRRVIFPRSKIHQLRPTISAKMNFKNLDAQVVRKYYFPVLPTST